MILKFFILLMIVAILWHIYMEYRIQKYLSATDGQTGVSVSSSGKVDQWAKADLLKIRQAMLLVPICQILVALAIAGSFGWALVFFGVLGLIIDIIKLKEIRDLGSN